MFICKKQYKQLMKEFKKVNPPVAVDSVLKDKNTLHVLRGFVGIGEPFIMHIKPHLKKIRIIDPPPFEYKPLQIDQESIASDWKGNFSIPVHTRLLLPYGR